MLVEEAPTRLTQPEVVEEKATTLEILKRTRELLNSPDKWCQFRFYDPDTGGRCLTGALFSASRSFPVYNDEAATGAWKRVAAAIGVSTREIALWNDHAHRAYFEVERVLDDAIYQQEHGL